MLSSYCRILLIGISIAMLMGCGSGDRELDIESPKYAEAVAAFYTGLAALQVGQDRHAEEKMRRVSELYPDEAAAWANLGLLALRRNEFEAAEERLMRARSLAPENSHVEYLLGLLASARGRTDEAVDHLRESIRLDSTNVRAEYALIEQLEQRGQQDDASEIRSLVDAILRVDPDNLAVQIERARFAAVGGDEATVGDALDALEARSEGWPEPALQQFAAARSAVESGSMQEAITSLSFLNNILKREADYRESIAAVRGEADQSSELLSRFLWLPAPVSHPAVPDDSISFAVEPLFRDRSPLSSWTWARAVTLSADGLPIVVAAVDDSLFFEDGSAIALPGPSDEGGFIPLDYNYDFRVDLAFAGPQGFALLRQEADSTFADVSSELGLPAGILNGSYSGGWAADLDMEGDLDLLLAVPDGPPVVLRNNGDETFSTWPLFESVSGLRDFVWADLDGDGDPDAAMIEDSGRILFGENLRSRGMRIHEIAGEGLAVATADLNTDGILEMIVLREGGRIERIQQPAGASDGEQEELVAWDAMPSGGEVRLFVMDIDNNGALDLVVSSDSTTAAWLNDGRRSYSRLAAPIDAGIFTLADVSGSGRLDLIGISNEGAPVRLGNRGSVNYHSKSIRPQAAEALGDQRINPFGLGGEIEVRSGTLFQKQAITDAIVHFGIGENLVVDVARIVWPNGDVQAEFDLLSDETVQARQRLKGSCPWLFTFDGERMTFVTDFIWRSPLGLAINAQETAGIMMTEDWVKIEGSELRPRDGVYDVRVTADLWETHFFDHISLMIVDHPEDTEVFVDERFAFPPPPLAIIPTGPRQEIAHAETGDGRDVTEILTRKDEAYHTDIQRGQYQGVAEEHALIVDLGAAASGSIYLLAEGWIRPTDSSINVAISQGGHAPPQGVRLEIPDGSGGWDVVHDNLGFPAGKYKTIVVPLDGVFPAGADRKVRLSTNLEIYWDAIWWAPALPDTELRTTRMDPVIADLRFRGFSLVRDEDRSRPEVPVYDTLQGTAQIWQDLEGYYTRFGDVRELLADVDDRYVIMNAGDELAFEFTALEDPPDGWVRDYVLIGDGWVKDGDYNTSFSETVRPLPSHDQSDYSTPPGPLEEDPVYRRHADDWRQYHTRYVAPDRVRSALNVAEF